MRGQGLTEQPLPVLEPRTRGRTGPTARGGLAGVLAGGLPSTRQLLDSFGPLAQSVAAAHRHGMALGCAQPSRIRLADGRLEMAISPPPRGATVERDVQGLGAVLYALLTGFWPLPASDAELAGLPRAPRDRSGAAVPPSVLRHGLAPELSALAMAALGVGVDRSHARVRTAAAIGRVVGDLRAEWSSEVLPPPAHTDADLRGLWRADGDSPVGGDPDTARKLSLGMAGLALGTLAVLCFLGYQAASMLGIGPPSPPRVVVSANTPALAVPPARMVVMPPEGAPAPLLGFPFVDPAVAGPPAAPPPIARPPSAASPAPARQAQRAWGRDAYRNKDGDGDSKDSDSKDSDKTKSKDSDSEKTKSKEKKRRASSDD